MGATYTNEQGEGKPLVMGCYGVGVSRLAQSAVEQSYDKDGIIWPVAITPYHAIITIPVKLSLYHPGKLAKVLPKKNIFQTP